MMRNRLKPLLLSLSGLSISACSGPQLIPFSLIQESNQCHINTAKIVQISSQQAQHEFIKTYSLFKTSDTQQGLETLFKQHAQHEALFIVSHGTKPSSGYGFHIHGKQAELHDKRLTLPITLTSPAKGALSAQVMTSPCLVLGVDKHADYSSLVVDHLELDLPE